MELPPDERSADLPVLDYGRPEPKSRRWRVFFIGAGIGLVVSVMCVSLAFDPSFVLPLIIFGGPLCLPCSILNVSDGVFFAIMFDGSAILYGIYTVVLVYSPRRWWYLAGIIALHSVTGTMLWLPHP